jgi:hypothetical protein
VDPATLVVTALAVVLVLSYFAGGMLNRRRAAALARSLRARFADAAGAKITWLGRNSFRLELQQPARGVRQLAASALLAPREALLVWALWAVQGRGDLLDLKADLEALPRGAGLVFDPRHRLGRAAWRAAVAAGGQVSEAGVGGLRIASYDDPGRTLMQRLLPVAAEAGDVILLEIKAAQPRLTLLLSLRGAPEAAVSHLPPTISGLIAAATS